MKRVVFFMLAVFIVSISMYGDIGKGDWTQDEINYFKTKEYKGDKIDYDGLFIKWVAPYEMPGLTVGQFIGYGGDVPSSISKLIFIGKLDRETEFRYLSLLRNEIYARHGYKFKDVRLKAFFNQMPWYKPVSDEVQLNRHERGNVKTVRRMEDKIKAIVDRREKEIKFASDYKKEEILKLKYGNGPGEIGVDSLSDPPNGPVCYYVNEKGDIYILDDINERIEVFSGKGEFLKSINYRKQMKYVGYPLKIAADREGNIYLLGVHRYPDIKRATLIKIGGKGELKGKMDIPYSTFSSEGYYERSIVGINIKIKGDHLIIEVKGAAVKSNPGEVMGYDFGSINGLFSRGSKGIRKRVIVRDGMYRGKKVSSANYYYNTDINGNMYFTGMLGKSVYVYKYNGDYLGRLIIDEEIAYSSSMYTFVCDDGSIYNWYNDDHYLYMDKYTRE